MEPNAPRDFTSVSRVEAAEQLERIAAGLRAGRIDGDHLQGPVPDRVEVHASIDDGGLVLRLAWGARVATDAERLTRAEVHQSEQIREADEAVVRDAREGRMP